MTREKTQRGNQSYTKTVRGVFGIKERDDGFLGRILSRCSKIGRATAIFIGGGGGGRIKKRNCS